MSFEAHEVSIYTSILYYTAACGYIGRKVLLSLSDSKNYIYRAIKRALDQGHIQEHIATEKINSKKSHTIFYSITIPGIRYLSSQANHVPDDMAWVAGFTASAEELKLRKTKSLSIQQRMLRYLAVSGSTLLAAEAGFKVRALASPYDSVKQEEDKDTALDLISDPLHGYMAAYVAKADDITDVAWSCVPCETEYEDNLAKRVPRSENRSPGKKQGIANEAVAQWAMTQCQMRDQKQNWNGTIKNPDSKYEFINAYEIKTKIRNSVEGLTALYYSRITGILESPFKSVILYTGQKRGMSWANWVFRMDSQSYFAYQRIHPGYFTPSPDKLQGAILVDNAKMFSDLFLDKRKKGNGERMGEGYVSFVVFPIDRFGVKQIGQYMGTDMERYRINFVTAAVASGLYERNDGPYEAEFPLLNEDGTEMAVGTFIDTAQLYRLLAIHRRRQIPFGIICYEWQKEYYRRVLPDDVQFMFVE